MLNVVGPYSLEVLPSTINFVMLGSNIHNKLRSQTILYVVHMEILNVLIKDMAMSGNCWACSSSRCSLGPWGWCTLTSPYFLPWVVSLSIPILKSAVSTMCWACSALVWYISLRMPWVTGSRLSPSCFGILPSDMHQLVGWDTSGSISLELMQFIWYIWPQARSEP